MKKAIFMICVLFVFLGCGQSVENEGYIAKEDPTYSENVDGAAKIDTSEVHIWKCNKLKESGLVVNEKGMYPFPVVVYKFGATWCGPCRALKDPIKKLAADSKGQYLVIDVDADAPGARAFGDKYGVQGYPTIILAVEGEPVEKYGYKQKQNLSMTSVQNSLVGLVFRKAKVTVASHQQEKEQTR